MPKATTSQQAATRAAIVAAVKAFVERVEVRTHRALRLGYAPVSDVCWDALHAELAALERTVAADGETARE